jgi:O-antigen/teichoic acid export membrane protein
MSRVERLESRAKIALSTASQTIGNMVVALGAVAILRITTHALGPADYGLFVLVITYVGLFSLFADIGITAMTTRELARSGANRSSVLSAALSSRIVLSAFVIPIVIGTGALLYPHKGGSFHLAHIVMSFDVLFQAVQLTASTAFAVRVRGDLIALLSVANRALYVALAVLVTVFHGSYLWYIVAYVGADFVTAVVSAGAAHRTITLKWSSDIRQWWRSIVLAFPLGLIQIIGSVYSWIDSILLSLLRPVADLGFYSVAFNVVNLLGAIPSFLMQALIPSLVNSDRAEVSRLLNRAIYVLFCVGAPLAAGGIVFRVDIVSALAGSRFLPGATPLAILACTVPVTFLQTALGFTSVSIDRYRSLVFVGMGTLALNIVLNLILIPRLGPSGAANALLVSEIVSLIVTYRVFRHLSGIRVRWGTLWRPTIAASAIFVLTLLGNAEWASLGPVGSLLVGGCGAMAVYSLVLLLIGGIPHEITGLLHRMAGSGYPENSGKRE